MGKKITINDAMRLAFAKHGEYFARILYDRNWEERSPIKRWLMVSQQDELTQEEKDKALKMAKEIRGLLGLE